jgi:hypothetical protein
MQKHSARNVEPMFSEYWTTDLGVGVNRKIRALTKFVVCNCFTKITVLMTVSVYNDPITGNITTKTLQVIKTSMY